MLSEVVEIAVGQVIDVDADLMETGIDSLGVVQLASLLSERAGVELPNSIVFDFPTISQLKVGMLELAGDDQADATTGGAADVLAEVRTESKIGEPVGSRPSSPAVMGEAKEVADPQCQLQLLDGIATPSALPMWGTMLRDCHFKEFCVAQVYKLQPSDGVPQVSQALAALSSLHPMLRSLLTPPFFSIEERAPTAIDVVHMTLWSVISQVTFSDESAMAARLKEQVSKLPIDCATATMRAQLVCVGEQPTALALSIRREVCDLPSYQLLYVHLWSILEAQRHKEAVAPPELDVSAFSRHAIACHMHAQNSILELAPAQTICQLRLPFEKRNRRGVPRVRRGMSCAWLVDKDALMRAQHASRSIGVTLPALLLGSLLRCLRQRSRQTVFAISLTGLGRSSLGDVVVGNFSASVPLVLDSTNESSFADICRHVHEEMQQLETRETFVRPLAHMTIGYEVNNMQAMPKPMSGKQQADKEFEEFTPLDMRFSFNRYSDGFTTAVAYDQELYEEDGVFSLMESWISSWTHESGAKDGVVRM